MVKPAAQLHMPRQLVAFRSSCLCMPVARHDCVYTPAWSSAHLQSLRLGGLGSLGGGSSAESTPFGTSRAASGPIAAGAMLRTGSGVSKVLDC